MKRGIETANNLKWFWWAEESERTWEKMQTVKKEHTRQFLAMERKSFLLRARRKKRHNPRP